MGAAIICRRGGGINWEDVMFEPVSNPTTYMVRDYDLREGVYFVLYVHQYQYEDPPYPPRSLAIFVDGERVHILGDDGQYVGSTVEVDENGASRFSPGAEYYGNRKLVTAYRVITD